MSEADRTKWDQKYREGEGAALEPPAWLHEVRGELPPRGRAVDIAAGRGRIALWLAAEGFAVTAVDISAVGLAAAEAEGRRRGLTISTRCEDLEQLEAGALGGAFDAISCFRYRQPSLWGPLRRALAPGGVLLMEAATVVNLERHDKPPERFLLRPNELLTAADGLFVAYYREGWLGDFHLARLVARRA